MLQFNDIQCNQVLTVKHSKTSKKSITSVTFCALCPRPLLVLSLQASACGESESCSCGPNRSVFRTEVSAWRINCIRTANLSQSFRESCLCDYNRAQCFCQLNWDLFYRIYNADSNWSSPNDSVLELQACRFFVGDPFGLLLLVSARSRPNSCALPVGLNRPFRHGWNLLGWCRSNSLYILSFCPLLAAKHVSVPNSITSPLLQTHCFGTWGCLHSPFAKGVLDIYISHNSLDASLWRYR